MPEENPASEEVDEEQAANDSVSNGSGGSVGENTSESMLGGSPLRLCSPSKKRRRRGSSIERLIASSPVRTGSSGSGVSGDVDSLVALSPLRSYDSFPEDDDDDDQMMPMKNIFKNQEEEVGGGGSGVHDDDDDEMSPDHWDLMEETM